MATPPSGAARKTLGVRRRPLSAMPLPSTSSPTSSSSSSSSSHPTAAFSLLPSLSASHPHSEQALASSAQSPPPRLSPSALPPLNASVDEAAAASPGLTGAGAPHSNTDSDEERSLLSVHARRRARSSGGRFAPGRGKSAAPPSSNRHAAEQKNGGPSHSPSPSPLYPPPRRGVGRPHKTGASMGDDSASPPSSSRRRPAAGRRRRRRSEDDEESDDELNRMHEKALDDLIDGMGRDDEQDVQQGEQQRQQQRRPPAAARSLHSNGAAVKAERGGDAKRKPGRAHGNGTSARQRVPHSSATAPPTARAAASPGSSNGHAERAEMAEGELQPATQRVDTEEKAEAKRDKHAGGRERSTTRAGDVFKGTPPSLTDEEEALVRQINRVMHDIKGRAVNMSLQDMRKQLKVSHELTAFIDAEWAAEGEVSNVAFAAMKAATKAKRTEWRRKAREANRRDDDGEGRAPRKEKRAVEGSGEGGRSKKKKKPAIGEGDVKDLSFDGWKHLHKGKGHKKRQPDRQPGRDGDDEDFAEQLLSSEAVQQRKKSLRSRKQINYSAQLEDDPLTIVDLTWYPSKASQPFFVHVDPLIPVILDIHSHLADTEVIGVLSGEWLPSKSLLLLHSAYPCQSLHTDNDLVNVEIDPASLVDVSSRIEGQGSRVVGWYHSHPYFRNQPSMVDVENQRKYQQMFMGGGGEQGSSPFIGAIVTPYGTGEFKPLPSNVKWFFHKEGKGRGGGDGSGLGSGDFQGGGTPMELWTDVTEESERKQLQPHSAAEPHADVLQRMLDLCHAYAEYPTRVDFTERWEANGEVVADVGEEEGVLGGSQMSSPSGMSPGKGRMMRDVSEERSIRCKLDQFRVSLRQHLTLLERWDGAEKRRMVEAVIDSVAKWKPREGHAARPQQQQQQRGRGKARPAKRRRREEEEDEEEEEEEEEDEEQGDEDEVEEELAQPHGGDSTEEDSGPSASSEEFG